ncbi:glycosyltransferase [bacterium]|nr:glycosyltransferase [bacterium]
MEEAVRFEGFRQYGELPAFYAGAGAFVHPAHEEPWGLVVNEAMASGLPVLVSRRCGCAGDLVAEGKNGFLLDPGDPMQMAARMREMAELPDQARKKMGETSREIVARYGPEQFAQGMVRAAHTAVANPVKAGILDRLILEALARR